MSRHYSESAPFQREDYYQLQDGCLALGRHRFWAATKEKKNINVELLLLSFVQSREQVIKKTSNEATDEFYDRIMTWETTGSFVSVSDLKSIICKPLN